MKKLEFRKLAANDVEVRIQSSKNGWTQLLLYIDSRAAIKLLDETAGALNWKMEFRSEGSDVVGRMSIYDEEKMEWVFREDVGAESNIEARKGLYSDTYKRCLARWGVTELYTAPDIRIQGEYKYEKFSCSALEIDDNRVITYLQIKDSNGNVVFDSNTKKSFVPTSKSQFEQFTEWCADKVKSGEDRECVGNFYKFYIQPKKDNPEIKICEGNVFMKYVDEKYIKHKERWEKMRREDEIRENASYSNIEY